MSILGRLLGGVAKLSKRDAESLAEAIVARYQQRRRRGECRVDDQLFLELSQVLLEKAAQEVFERFRQRRARSDPQAETKLVVEIAVALRDADHFVKANGR
jgi:hypothetical protein